MAELKRVENEVGQRNNFRIRSEKAVRPCHLLSLHLNEDSLANRGQRHAGESADSEVLGQSVDRSEFGGRRRHSGGQAAASADGEQHHLSEAEPSNPRVHDHHDERVRLRRRSTQLGRAVGLHQGHLQDLDQAAVSL